MHNSLFVFDIETVPDTSAVRNLTGSESTDTSTLREELTQYHLDLTNGNNGFPRQPFHKIVAISFLEAVIHKEGSNTECYEFVRLESSRSDDEGELVEKFFQYFDKKKPRLVSFNGRGFDLPVLKFRAMKHGVQAAALHKGGDKWNNYTSRYSADWHCDLLDVMKDYGAVSGGLKLNEACAIMGFPGKFGVDGSQVSDMYDRGELDAIRHYCETDVLNTYLVYLRYQHHTGTLSTGSYNTALEDVLSFLEESAPARPYLADFHEAWKDACDGVFLLQK